MSAIRLAPRDTSFEIPASFDPGTLDFYSTMAYDSLYHSPVSALYRGGTLAYEDFFGSENTLSTDEATSKYGMEGQLKFDEPIRESAAKLMQDRKIAELRRTQLLDNGFTHGSVGRGALGFGVSLGASLLDPINLASMFIPVVGPSKLLSGTVRTGVRFKGFTTTYQLARTLGPSRNKIRLATGAIEGLVGQAAVEPLILFPNIYEQSNYGFNESLTNLAVAPALGGLLHFGAGKIGDKFSEISQALQPRPDDPRFNDFNGIEEDTHREIIQTTLAQLARDEPATSAHELLRLDRKVVLDELRNDIAERSRQQLNEYYVRQSRVGYDLLVDQLRNKGSRLGWDSKAINRQITKELGSDFETKIKRELTGTEPPIKPIDNFESIQTNQIDVAVRIVENDFVWSDDLDNLEFDWDHPLKVIKDEGRSKSGFLALYKEALKRGYDLTTAEIKAGAQSLVFVLKNRVVKFSTKEFTASEIPGLTTVSELKLRRNKLFMNVSERVKPLENINLPEENFTSAFDEIGSIIGKTFDDVSVGNLGINSKGELVLFDTGHVFEVGATGREINTGASPNLTPTSEIGKKLFAQMKANEGVNPKVTKTDIQAEINRRVKNLASRKRREYKAEQKVLDKEPEISKARESSLLGQPIKTTPDPVENVSVDVIKENSADIQSQNALLEQELKTLLDEESLTPDEARLLEQASAGLENIPKLRQALKRGIDCINSKQI